MQAMVRKRLQREKQTVEKMIRIFCHKQHHQKIGLCEECKELQKYAINRLDSCKFGEKKPTCGKCTVHCYKPLMKKKIISVMRYSGPKMIYFHPVNAIRHLIDGFYVKTEKK